jgi:AraC-like DNA-binding protein
VSGTSDTWTAAPGGQSYRERKPAPALAQHLSCIWIQRVGSGATPYTHGTIPNGAVELACEIGAVPRVAGPQTGPTAEVLAPGTTVVGVRFHPGAAPSALGLPASELLDLSVGSDELWGGSAVALGERLAESESPEHAALLLERELLSRVHNGTAPDPIVTEAVRRLLPGRADAVRALSSSLYISERQLRRRCLAAIGLSPKAVELMLRFQGFLALAHARGLAKADLAQLAADAGYADQPHLGRECRRLSGKSPVALLREAEEHCRGVHDHAASHAPLLRSHGIAAAA